MPEWSAEVVVDEPLARRLIAGQFPDLAGAELRFLDAGWDQTVWLVDGRWAFRFPRRQIAIPGVRRELAVLPGLRVPLPIPRPVYVGEPAHGFPWPFFGGPFLPGREPIGLGEEQRRGLGRPLGEFLRALHAHPGDGLPVDPMGRADMVKRVRMARERCAAAGWEEPAWLDASFPPPEPPVLVHGDLHLRHLLVDDAGGAAGVIDFGDVCRADPAIDLPLYWCLLPPAGRTEFLDAYGDVSEAQLLRARVLAVMLSATLALYARDEGFPALAAEALAAFRRSA